VANITANHEVTPRLSFGQIYRRHASDLAYQLDSLAITKAFPPDSQFCQLAGLPATTTTPRQRLDLLRERCYSKLKYKPGSDVHEFKFTSSRYIVTRREDKLFVLLYPHPKYQGLLLSTGGHIEARESYEEAGLRERKEELAISTLQVGKLLQIPASFFPPCHLTRHWYSADQSIFEVGALFDPVTKAPTRFDIRTVEFHPDLDIERSYPAVHERLDKPRPPDFKFVEIDLLCTEASTAPKSAFLDSDPTYYQRFTCLKHFLALAKKAKKI
jgi:8-oxo-dGTP pyrophosphatase MutT (NUDIX family)